jgi:hypothetical protein
LAKHVQQAMDNNTMIYLIAGGITAFLLILISLFAVAICKSKKRRQFLKEIPPPPPISQRASHSLTDLGQRSQNIYVLNSSSSTNSLPHMSSVVGGFSDQPMSTMTTTSTLPDIAMDKHSSSYDVWNYPARESNYATVNKLADFTSLFTKRSPVAAETDNYVGSLMGFPSLQHISSPRLTASTRHGPVSLLSLNASGLTAYQDHQTVNHNVLPSSQPNLSHQLPLQVFRTSSLSEDAPSSSAGDHSPTYQNWSTSGASTASTGLKSNKSGLATTKRIRGKVLGGSDCATSSTECSHSDDGESDHNGGSSVGKRGKNVYNVSSARITKLSTPPTPAPRTALSSKQTAEQERKKRQESLV